MNGYKRLPLYAGFILLLVFSFFSCDSGGGAGGTTGPFTGTLNLGLTDKPGIAQAVYITINEVQVHPESGTWVTLSNTDLDLPQTVNLLDLVNGVVQNLGATELDAGLYDQMRLILEDSEATPPPGDLNILGNAHPYYNYLIDELDNEIQLKVPSGGNTGVKLVGGFNIEFSGSTELILDFDALKSIVQAGNSGKWLLKPVIKVVDSVTNSVSGTVTDGSTAVAGAAIHVQLYQPDAADYADQIETVSGAVSDDAGEYFAYLPFQAPTDIPYNIVTVADGFLPMCQRLSSNAVGAYTADFPLTVLSPGDTGTLSAQVDGLATAEDFAVVSVRQSDGNCDEIEVASIQVANTMPTDPAPIVSAPVSLAYGSYRIVISAEGRVTQEIEDFEVFAGQDNLLEIHF